MPTNRRRAPEALLIERYLRGELKDVKKVLGVLSVNERITFCLGTGLDDELPDAFSTFRNAWRRLDGRQRRIVTRAVKYVP
jgi:hypothetical protein